MYCYGNKLFKRYCCLKDKKHVNTWLSAPDAYIHNDVYALSCECASQCAVCGWQVRAAAARVPAGGGRGRGAGRVHAQPEPGRRHQVSQGRGGEIQGCCTVSGRYGVQYSERG